MLSAAHEVWEEVVGYFVYLHIAFFSFGKLWLVMGHSSEIWLILVQQLRNVFTSYIYILRTSSLSYVIFYYPRSMVLLEIFVMIYKVNQKDGRISY